MKKHILPALKLTLLSILLLAVVYPMIIWAIAQMAPNQGKGEILKYKGNTYYTNIGQAFTADEYFSSRPSAVDYNAAGSAGSNKGPSNVEYLEEIKERVNTFLDHNPGIQRAEIPIDLITASGSGLDPNISTQAARVQVKRIAKIRGLNEVIINKLITQYTDKPLWDIFGPEKINVLKLNIALDNLHQ